jgi:acetyl esterase/lipase
LDEEISALHLNASWKLGGLLALLACSDGPTGSGEPARQSLANVAYGPEALQVMDIELPAGRTASTPVVVFIHGGGWTGGDKSIFQPIDLDQFVAKGFATANINYRLAGGTTHHPILSQDVTAALDFLATHAAEYQVAPDRFAVVGHSAGGHLALLAGYLFNPSGRIKAVGSMAGPTDLTDPVWLSIPGVRQLLENFLGVTQAQNPAIWIGASPFQVVRAGAPPTVLVYGRQDVLVPYWQADNLAGKLEALEVPVDYYLFHVYNHDLGAATNLHFPNQVLDPIMEWFERYLK